MAGGVDGLNTVIPYNDGAYWDARPDLAIAEKDLLVLNERAAFHPSFGSLKPIFDEGFIEHLDPPRATGRRSP